MCRNYIERKKASQHNIQRDVTVQYLQNILSCGTCPVRCLPISLHYSYASFLFKFCLSFSATKRSEEICEPVEIFHSIGNHCISQRLAFWYNLSQFKCNCNFERDDFLDNVAHDYTWSNSFSSTWDCMKIQEKRSFVKNASRPYNEEKDLELFRKHRSLFHSFCAIGSYFPTYLRRTHRPKLAEKTNATPKNNHIKHDRPRERVSYELLYI